ncbi:MAG: hypothetical protein JWM99_4790 [Verrucomicrobiales bacterium]|nr:hypothetical protein [Verrucomicrobiales bacterium]
MKRFEFNLQSVLVLRQREEKKAQEVYARELLGRQQARDLLAQVEAELDRERAILSESARISCSASKLMQARRSYEKLSERRDACAKAMSEAERRANSALAQMLMRRQQRRIVDTYYDKRRAEYNSDLMKTEQKESDELASRGSLGVLQNNNCPV